MANVTGLVSAELAASAGSAFLGGVFNWGLYGVLSYQVYIYYVAFPREGWTARSLVYGIYILDTFQTVLVTTDHYNTFAKRFGDRTVLDAMLNEWLAVPVLSSIISCTVQLYYAYRIQALSGSRVLPLPVYFFAIIAGVAGIASGAQAEQLGRYSLLQPKASVSTGIWLAGDTLCDIIIAASMAYLLIRHDNNLLSTHTTLHLLVRIIIETGILTALAALTDVLLFFTFPHTSYHVCAATVLAKLYSNSLLAMFNSRLRIDGARENMGHNGTEEEDEEVQNRRSVRLETMVFAAREMRSEDVGDEESRISDEPSSGSKKLRVHQSEPNGSF